MVRTAVARIIRRAWLPLGSGALLGIAVDLTVSTAGCVYHDTCIKVTSAGHDWCRNLALAKQWPAGGSFEDATSILRPDGGSPRGCLCYNDAEQEIFGAMLPECRYEGFLDDLEQAARQECEVLAMPGYDHNCWITSGEQASIVEDQYPLGAGSCIGNCEYGAPPAGGSCPDPNPYECATGGYDADACESEGDAETDADDSADTTDGDTTGGVMLDFDGLVSCDGPTCEIDEVFARSLYADPSPLLGQRTRLVYDTKTKRHVVQGVEPDSLAHALGLRNGDRLESVGGITIHDLDSALQAHAQLGHETTLHVRVKRGTQWLDLSYLFVP
ncbi:MAG: hypothetical protein KDK70_28070 [Myxococcales bacterium]|nr:hypothetical protein [Myxococcales bacterium]